MPKRKRNFRWVKWLVFLVLIIVAVVIIILVKNNFDNNIEKENNSQQDVIDNKDKDDSSDKKPEEKSENKEQEQKQKNKAPQYEGESPNESETLTGLITYADVINDELTIRVNIDQFLQSGNCNLKMSRNGVTYYTQSVGIQESVTTSTCDGYKIPVSELPKGDLSVEIDLDSDGKSGKITGRVRI